MNEVSLRLKVLDEDDLITALDIADTAEISVEATTDTHTGQVAGQVEPVTAVLVAAGVTAAAKFIVDWWDRLRGGLVIDQRPGRQDDIYRDRDVPFGYIVVFPPDGKTVKIETRDAPKDAAERLLGAVISGGLTTAKEVAEAAKAAVGHQNVDALTAG
jgi:hypothetical protein